MTTNLDFLGTKLAPTYGGQKELVEYSLKTVTNGIRNEYIVVGEVRGIQDNDPYISEVSCKALNNNEETLIPSAVYDIMGW